MSNDEWYVYVLRNPDDGRVYTGCTNRPHYRLDAHRGLHPKGARTTSSWRRVEMVILIGPMRDDTGAFESKSLALSLERSMKKSRAGPCGGIKGRFMTLHKLLCSRGGKVNGKVRASNLTCIKTIYSRAIYIALCKTKRAKEPKVPFEHLLQYQFKCATLP